MLASLYYPLLSRSLPMHSDRIQALIAFLNTLTDRQFKYLLEE